MTPVNVPGELGMVLFRILTKRDPNDIPLSHGIPDWPSIHSMVESGVALLMQRGEIDADLAEAILGITTINPDERKFKSFQEIVAFLEQDRLVKKFIPILEHVFLSRSKGVITGYDSIKNELKKGQFKGILASLGITIDHTGSEEKIKHGDLENWFKSLQGDTFSEKLIEMLRQFNFDGISLDNDIITTGFATNFLRSIVYRIEEMQRVDPRDRTPMRDLFKATAEYIRDQNSIASLLRRNPVESRRRAQDYINQAVRFIENYCGG